MENRQKEVVIEPINLQQASLSIEGEYTVDGVKRTLLQSGEIYPGILPKERQHERVDLRITKNSFITIPVERSKLDAVKADFYSQHPGAVVPGPNGKNLNPNFVKPLFVYRDRTNEGKNKVSDLKLELRVSNMVNNIDEHGQFNLAMAIGVNPLALNEEEIYLAVMGYAKAAPLDFLKLLKRTDLEYLVIVKKAIKLGEIVQRDNVYRQGEVVLGSDEEQCIAYYKHNDEPYKILRKKVAFKDDLPLGGWSLENVGAIGVTGLEELPDVDDVLKEGENAGKQANGRARTGNRRAG